MEVAIMKFFGRDYELDILNTIYMQCKSSYGKITVITGRRRIGKTLLAKEYAKDKDSVYLFTSRKTEKMLCEEYLPLYEQLTGEPYIGSVERFSEIFELFMKYGITKPFVLIVDEFQEYAHINPSVFSEIQNIWDSYKFRTHVHILFIGSIYSMMVNIFQNEKEPLFGRADRIIYLKPFSIFTVKEVLEVYDAYTVNNLFIYYLITGGVPRYMEILLENTCFTQEMVLNYILSKDSFFLEEGKNLLIQEFGKEYGIYFSILELIASGKTSRQEIESVITKSIGGHLQRLEDEYDIVRKVRPIGAKKDSRNQKYQIKDHFMRFWFRFIYKNFSQIENERFTYVIKLIHRDLPTYSGHTLERLFLDIYSRSSDYSVIGTYWERGNKNEIDLVAIDDFHLTMSIAEIKLNKEKISIQKLQKKAEGLVKPYSNYAIQYEALSMEDIEGKMEEYANLS